MADPMAAGEGGIIGAVIGAVVVWFTNIIYMREKFVSAKQCDNCKQATSTTETIQIKGLQDRMGAMEGCVNDLYKQSKDNHGMIREIHGWLKSKNSELL